MIGIDLASLQIAHVRANYVNILLTTSSTFFFGHDATKMRGISAKFVWKWIERICDLHEIGGTGGSGGFVQLHSFEKKRWSSFLACGWSWVNSMHVMNKLVKEQKFEQVWCGLIILSNFHSSTLVYLWTNEANHFPSPRLGGCNSTNNSASFNFRNRHIPITLICGLPINNDQQTCLFVYNTHVVVLI